MLRRRVDLSLRASAKRAEVGAPLRCVFFGVCSLFLLLGWSLFFLLRPRGDDRLAAPVASAGAAGR
eukprot:6060113-Amphidinium_carterae.1